MYGSASATIFLIRYSNAPRLITILVAIANSSENQENPVGEEREGNEEQVLDFNRQAKSTKPTKPKSPHCCLL